MQTPLQIVFRHLDHSDAVSSRIKERAAWLERFHGRIISCRVAVDAPHRHHHTGNLFQVRVNLRVPGGELVTGRTPARHGAHKDIYVAIRDAFDEARRLLEQVTRRRRREVKHLETPTHGMVVRIVQGQGEEAYGFLRTESGEDVYFHRNSVLHGKFDDLRPGSEVRCAIEPGDEGPQASSVEAVGRQGRRFLGRREGVG